MHDNCQQQEENSSDNAQSEDDLSDKRTAMSHTDLSDSNDERAAESDSRDSGSISDGSVMTYQHSVVIQIVNLKLLCFRSSTG